MLSLRLRQHQEFEFDGAKVRFVKELADRRALFMRDATGAELVLGEREIEDAIAAGKFRQLSGFEDRKGRRTPHNDMAEIGPDGPRDPLATARAFYVRQWDKTPTPRTTAALKAFVKLHAPAAKAIGIEWEPSASALRRAIVARGEPGARPMRVMEGRIGRAMGWTKFPGEGARLIREAVAFFYGERQRDIMDAYAWLRDAYARLNSAGSAADTDFVPLVPPTYETLRKKIKDAYCRENWARKTTVLEARQRFDGTAPGLAASQILETVVIDSTPDDVFLGMFLVDAKRMLPLGRPTVTLAVDVHSRMPCAIVVTYEPMSLYTAMTALMEVNAPKHRWREQDRKMTRDLDAWGRPSTIIVDNAWEQVGISFQDACQDVGIAVEWAPVKTPEYKAIVERLVHTMQTLVTHKFKGAVTMPPHLMRKFGLTPHKDYCVDIEDFRQLLRRAFVEVYQMETHAGLGMAPAKAWEESKVKTGRPFVRDLNFLAAAFGKTDDVTLTREGVRYRNLRFHDQHVTSTLLDQLAHTTPVRARRTGGATAGVKVKYDPADCRKLQVWNHVTKRYVELPNVDSRYFQGDSLSWAQHDLIVRYAKASNLDFFSDEDRWAARNALRRDIEAFAPSVKKVADMRNLRRVLNPPEPHAAVVEFGHVVPSTGGSASTDIEIVPASYDRADDGIPEPGARRGNAKGKRTGGSSKRGAPAKSIAAKPPVDDGGTKSVAPKDSIASRFDSIASRFENPTRSPDTGSTTPDWIQGRRSFYDE